MGSHRCVDHSNDLHYDSLRQQVEKAASTAEQHGDLVHVQFIEDIFLDGRPCRVGTMDRDTVMMVTAPVVDLFDGTAAGLRLRPSRLFRQRIAFLPPTHRWSPHSARRPSQIQPLVQPHRIVATRVVRCVAWSSDEPSTDIDM